MKKIIDYLKYNDNFIVTSHISPDGDNIGSSIAMNRFLKNIGKNSFHILDDYIPNNLLFLLDDYKILNSIEFLDKIKKEDDLRKYTVIALDCSNFERLCIDKRILSNNIINIDHHISNENYGFINHVDPPKSSTCEVLYGFLKNIDETKIDKYIATSLYTGLSTDTGNFKFDNVSKNTFIMASELLGKGADKQSVVTNIYQSDDYNYIRLKSDLMLNNFKIKDDIALMTVSKKILKKYSIDVKDTEDLANCILNIKDVEIGVLLKEYADGIIKGSLRSKKYADVNEIASKLNGGGHKRAAGFRIKASMDETKKIVLEVIEEYKKNEWSS